MNVRTPYWPLFRNELGFDHGPKVAWALGAGVSLAGWLVGSSVPLLLLFKASEGNLGTFFAAFEDLFGFALVWWLAITGWMFAFALFPGISNPIQSVRAFEFMFTRAIDRRRLFRIRAAVIYLMMLGPLLLNLLVSAGAPEPTLGPDASEPVSSTFRQEQYSRTFPASHAKEGRSRLQPALLVIPRGAVVLTAWIFWFGTAGLVLMQGYCALLATRVQHSPWLAGIAVGAPVLLAFGLAPRLPRHLPHLYEENFLFFARHLVPLMLGLLALIPLVQLFSERRFRALEIT